MKLFAISLLVALSTAIYSQEAPLSIDQSSFYKWESALLVNKAAWSKEELIVQYQYNNVEKLEIELRSYKSLRAKNPTTSKILQAICDGNNCNFMVKLSDLSEEDSHILLFTDIESNTQYTVNIDPAKEYTTPLLITNAFDDISLRRSFSTGEEIYFKALNNKNDIYIYHYDQRFNAASSPTGSRRQTSKDMRPKYRFHLQSGKFLKLEEEGLYFAQTDTMLNEGYAFRVQNHPYPSYNSLADLKKCMVYITTSEEWKRLTSTNEKSTFDEIWLNASANENSAKYAIRNYYNNINVANKLFTTYKEGWKTDKGMIYAVFGPPNEVIKTESGETWTYLYDGEMKDQKFTFISRPNIFSPYHSILQRNREFGTIWHYTIEKLRQGIKLNE